MKIFEIFAAVICIAIILPTSSVTAISIAQPKCNCHCPLTPRANTSGKAGIVCRCPACPIPTCHCQPCGITPIQKSTDVSAAPTSILPRPIRCFCPRCPPPMNPPVCNCARACPMIEIFCACPLCVAAPLA